MRESGMFGKMAGAGFGLSFFRTRILPIMLCAVLLLGGAFMLNTPTDVAAATRPTSEFRIGTWGRTCHFDPVNFDHRIVPGIVALYRDGTRVDTTPVISEGEGRGFAQFFPTVPGYYAVRMIYAPRHILGHEFVSLGYWDGTPGTLRVTTLYLDAINPIPAPVIPTGPRTTYRFWISCAVTEQMIPDARIWIFRDDIHVQTIITDSRGTAYYHSLVAGYHSAIVESAPGFVVDVEIIPLRHFNDGIRGGVQTTDLTLVPGNSAPVVVPPQVQTPSGQRILRFAIGNATFTDNGVPHVVEAAPFVAQGRTMVPLRAIVEAFGSEDVAFNSGVITFSVGKQAFTMTIGQALIGADGAYMGTPVTVAGRTFVPLRFIIDSLDAEVRWDGANQAAYIYIN